MADDQKKDNAAVSAAASLLGHRSATARLSRLSPIERSRWASQFAYKRWTKSLPATDDCAQGRDGILHQYGPLQDNIQVIQVKPDASPAQLDTPSDTLEAHKRAHKPVRDDKKDE